MKNLSAAELFILKYETDRFVSIFPATLIILVVSTFGFFGNFNIVWSSFRKKSLRSNCNILIATIAFSDIFHQVGHFILAYHLFYGSTFIGLNKCLKLQLLPVFAMNYGTCGVLSVGVDRLLSVAFPITYKKIDGRIYLAVMLGIPIAYSVWGCLIAILESSANTKIICVIVEAYHGKAKDLFIHSALIINAIILLVYPLIWIIIRGRTGAIDIRILRSITVIVFFVLFGWFMGAACVSMGLIWKWDEERIFKTHMYVGCFINVGIAVNYPVYGYFCRDYLHAFEEQLYILTFRGLEPLRAKRHSQINSMTDGKRSSKPISITVS